VTRPPEISRVHLTPGTERDRKAGLLGYLTFRLGDDLLVDGCTLRRSREGLLRLSFPERRDGRGRTHPLLRPVCQEARDRLERRVFEELGLLPNTGGGGER
jgi:DNA-binding cell septation regulator SpoVG